MVDPPPNIGIVNRHQKHEMKHDFVLKLDLILKQTSLELEGMKQT